MSSALRLITGLLDGKKVANVITQTSHGFSAGFVVRYDTDTAGFTAAQATLLKVQRSQVLWNQYRMLTRLLLSMQAK